MLGISDIMYAASEGLSVCISRRNPLGIKGEYDSSYPRITLYPANNDSSKDLGVTVLHEFIHHKRDDAKSNRSSGSDECSVEAEALAVYEKRPYLLQFIKELYNLKPIDF